MWVHECSDPVLSRRFSPVLFNHHTVRILLKNYFLCQKLEVYFLVSPLVDLGYQVLFWGPWFIWSCFLVSWVIYLLYESLPCQMWNWRFFFSFCRLPFCCINGYLLIWIFQLLLSCSGCCFLCICVQSYLPQVQCIWFYVEAFDSLGCCCYLLFTLLALWAHHPDFK